MTIETIERIVYQHYEFSLLLFVRVFLLKRFYVIFRFSNITITTLPPVTHMAKFFVLVISTQVISFQRTDCTEVF